MNKRSIMTFGGLLLAFAIPFEMIANIAVEIRTQGPLFPLSYQAVNTRVSSDALGYRSSIYRGQERRWAVFGTSYLFSPQVHQDELWSTKLERTYKGKLHISNFSYAGSTQTVAESIRQSAVRKEQFDKVFLVLSIGFGEVATPIPLSDVFSTTGRFFPLSDDKSPFTSWKILKRLLLPEVLRLDSALGASLFADLSLGQPAFATQNATNTYPQDTEDSLAKEHLGDFKECYQIEMIKRQCEAKYHGALPADASREQRWSLYETEYLPCQRTADLACGIKRRHEVVPKNYYGNQTAYLKQVARLVESMMPLSREIYLVVRAVGTGEKMEPDTLAHHTGLVAGEVDSRYVVLSTKRAAYLERLRNQELFEAALMYQSKNPSVKILNLQSHFDEMQATSSHFRDYAHLSSLGNQLVADYLLDQFKEEK